MRNDNSLRAGVGRSSIAPVARRFIRRGLRGIFRRGRFRLFQNVLGLFRGAWCRQHSRQRMQYAFQLLAFRFTQRRVRAAIDDLVQLFQIHIHPGVFHVTFHAPSNSRNLAFRGKPSICFTGRLCWNVGARCPRPAVVPITCQLAAR